MSFQIHDNVFSQSDIAVTEHESTRLAQGAWRLCYIHGRPGALVGCPNCGRRLTVTPGEIQDNGSTRHAVICDKGVYDDAQGCGWFDCIHLDGFAAATGRCIATPTQSYDGEHGAPAPRQVRNK